jgi:Holliday junction resolvasome RuvABC endonuclease subunit
MPTVRRYTPQVNSQSPGANRTSAPSVSAIGVGAQGVSAQRVGTQNTGTVTTGAQTTSVRMTGPARSAPMSNAFRNPLPSDSFGVAAINPGAVGNAMTNLGTGITRLAAAAAAMQERVNTTAAEEALVNFEREKNNAFFDPDNGYFNTQGKVAYDKAKETRESLVELQNRYSESLESPQAREMFDRAATQHLTRAETEIMRHASNQYSAWEQRVIGARVENSLDNASRYWNDPEQLATNFELGRQSIIDMAYARGDISQANEQDLIDMGVIPGEKSDRTPEQIAQIQQEQSESLRIVTEEVHNFDSKFAMNAIESAINTSAAAGQTMLADMSSLLETRDLINIQTKIDQKTVAETTQRNAAAAITISNSLVSQYGDEPNAQQLINAEVNAIEDTDLQERVRRESRYQLGLKMQADSEARGQYFIGAEAALMTGSSIDQWIAGNADQWHAMEPNQQKVLLAGPVTQTNFNVLSDLLLKPASELARINPPDYFTHLAEGDRMRLINAVEAARTGSPESQIGRTITQQITSSVEQIFGEPNKRNNEESKQVDAFYATVTAEMAYRSSQLQRPLTSEEVTSMLSDMTREVIIEKRWWPDTTMTMADIPAADMQPLSDFLRQSGYPVTSENLIRAYRQASQ